MGAENCTYTNTGAEVRTIRVSFDNGYAPVTVNGVEVINTDINIKCRVTDILSGSNIVHPKNGEQFQIGGITYVSRSTERMNNEEWLIRLKQT